MIIFTVVTAIFVLFVEETAGWVSSTCYGGSVGVRVPLSWKNMSRVCWSWGTAQLENVSLQVWVLWEAVNLRNKLEFHWLFQHKCFFFLSTYDIFADCLIARISQSIMTLNESKYVMLGSLRFSAMDSAHSSSQGCLPATLMQIKTRTIR